MSCNFVANIDTIRVTEVDACGKPVVGAENAFVTNCVATLAMNVVTDDQDDKIFRAANGNLCAIKRGCRTLLGYDTELTVLQASPEMIGIMTGNPAYLDAAGETVGFDDCSIQCNAGYAIEFWAELAGQVCSTTGAVKYLYGVLPWVTNGLLSDLELGAEAVNFQLDGSTRAGGQWGTGPFNVVNGTGGTPAKMTTPLGATCHRRMLITELAPPVASCVAVAVPA
ncbi:hypothetical protein [Streptomyces phage phiSAJS1]|uniref:major tail protein n=1 Tax=Streptomyces phage phiSAJS1 TaxID=1755682 RepID=UPI0007212D89|nr:major tail protein [Streptomyces phage phiSAJS1]ALO79406.1 hypothetical protein [Streptomyces phage phiSAJS1]